MSFKQYLKEVASLKYDSIPPKAKFTVEEIEKYIKVAKVTVGLKGTAGETWEDILG